MTTIRRGVEPRKQEEACAKKRRRIGDFWVEEGGRYICCYGPNGLTVFNSWTWAGEPLPRRRA